MAQTTIKYRLSSGGPLHTITVSAEDVQKTIREFEEKGYIIEFIVSGWESF